MTPIWNTNKNSAPSICYRWESLSIMAYSIAFKTLLSFDENPFHSISSANLNMNQTEDYRIKIKQSKLIRHDIENAAISSNMNASRLIYEFELA